MSGHFKLKSTIHRLAASFHWKDIKADVSSFIAKCVLCNVTSDKLSDKTGLYYNFECNILNSCIHFDLSGPWSKDSKGFQYVLILVENCTRYVTLVPIKNKTAKIVADAILHRYIGYFGPPNNFFSDLGLKNNNKIMKNICTSLEIKHNFCPVQKHSANLSERSIKKLFRFFEILSGKECKIWSGYIPFFQVGLNSCFNKTLGMSSYKALTGRMVNLPINVALGPVINLLLNSLSGNERITDQEPNIMTDNQPISRYSIETDPFEI